MYLQPLISEIVSEDISSTTIITRVKATDADEYDSIHFELSGQGSEQFRLDRSSGMCVSDVNYSEQHRSAICMSHEKCTFMLF